MVTFTVWLIVPGGKETCNGITVNGVMNYYHMGKRDGDDYVNINCNGSNSIMNIYFKTYKSDTEQRLLSQWRHVQYLL